MVWFGYGMAWLATCIAVSISLFVTHSMLSLLALIIPACIFIEDDNKNTINNDDKK